MKYARSVIIRSVIFGVVWVLFFAGIGFAQSNAAPDEENCLICHRYPLMGRYDDTGKKRIYYINDQLFAKSVHGKLRCKSCHVDLDKIPHEEVKKVDCSTQCHIKDPSSNREFSHKGMVDLYDQSVHGQGVIDRKRFPEDRPTCTYCHENTLYTPYTAGYWGKSEELSRETLVRCQGCHTDKNWTKKIYSHFTHRMRRRRGQDEIIKLCTSCHENAEKMERHGLEAVSTFKDTYHWTLVKYEVKDAPDCITCHVPVGYSTHQIKPRIDKDSPLNKNNRINTCSNQGGIQSCHPGATANFAEGRVHAYGTKVQLMADEEMIKNILPEAKPIMLARAKEEISREEVSHYKVLLLIKWVYQLLIACVIGFMSLHQLLDYRRTRKKIKTEKKEAVHGSK